MRLECSRNKKASVAREGKEGMVGEVTERARVQIVKGNVVPGKDFEFYSQCDGKPLENSDERLLVG